MSTYGRNFEFRVQPHQGQRRARYVLSNSETGGIPFGAPVVVDDDAVDAGKRQVLVLADGDVEPVQSKAGIALYEHAFEAEYGYDPVMVVYSDIDKAPLGKSVYLVSGTQVKIVLRNTVDRSFFGQQPYTGRTMIAGINAATPAVAVGDFLRPADDPSDDTGYWQVADSGEDAWLVVDHVDPDRNEVEATFVF